MKGTYENQIDSAQEYRELLISHYENLKDREGNTQQTAALAEVRLRLFLSLLDKPRSFDSSTDTPYSSREQQCS
jgi:hypothetical protein